MPRRGRLPETRVQPAAVVGTPTQPQASGQHRLGGRKGPPPTHQGRQRRANGGVQPLDVCGSAPGPAVGGRQHGGASGRGPAHHPRFLARHPPLHLPHDHWPSPPSLLQDPPRPPTTAGVHGVPEHMQEGRHGAGQPIPAHQRGDHDQSAVGADDAPPPQPRRHGHRHPHAASHPLPPQLSRLDVRQVDLPLLDYVLRHPPAVLARAGSPGGPGARLDPAGRDDGRGRTALAPQGQDHRHHRRGRPPAVAGRGGGGRTGGAPGGPSLARRRAPRHVHVPLPHLASGSAVRRVAAWGLRVHRWPPRGAIWPAQPHPVGKEARRTRFFSSHQTASHGSLGWYP